MTFQAFEFKSILKRSRKLKSLNIQEGYKTAVDLNIGIEICLRVSIIVTQLKSFVQFFSIVLSLI